MGLDRYYRGFVDGFASIASPLITLNQKKVKFEWYESCKRSFQVLKDKLTSALVLSSLDGKKYFIVYSHAC